MQFKRLFQVAMICLAIYFGMSIERALGADQPHMTAAQTELQAALDELHSAEADKGGHRETAISLVNEALEQVKQGMISGDK